MQCNATEDAEGYDMKQAPSSRTSAANYSDKGNEGLLLLARFHIIMPYSRVPEGRRPTHFIYILRWRQGWGKYRRYIHTWKLQHCLSMSVREYSIWCRNTTTWYSRELLPINLPNWVLHFIGETLGEALARPSAAAFDGYYSYLGKVLAGFLVHHLIRFVECRVRPPGNFVASHS